MPAFVTRERIPPTLNGEPVAPPGVNIARTLRRLAPALRAGSRAAITTLRDLPDVARFFPRFFATVPPLCVGRILAMYADHVL